MPRIPDDDTYRERWSSMSVKDRRHIVKAVNKGKVLDDRGEAALAVVLAQRQQSFWRWAWVAGPLVSLINIGAGWAAYAVNALISTIILGALCLWRYRRMQQSEERNRAHATGRRPSPQGDGGGEAAGVDGDDPGGRPRGHTPAKDESDGPALPPDAKGVRPGAGEPKRSRRDRKG